MGKAFSKQENSKDHKIKKNSVIELENVKTIHGEAEEDLIDPRSPHPYNLCRTPVNEFTEPKTPVLQENSFKKRLLQSLKLNPFDPRSPTNLINRTPIVFNADESDADNVLEKGLNLNDTFSDLFVESRPLDSDNEQLSTISISSNIDQPTTDNEQFSIISISSNIESIIETFQKDEKDSGACLDTSVKVDIIEPEKLLNERDPRSPSIEVNRTPIVFEDDDSSSNNELEMIENVLESIKFSNEKPKHKLIERVKNPPKSRPKRKIRSSSRLSTKNNNYKLKINNENLIYSGKRVLSSTPKRKIVQLEEKRTPLGCVGNKSHLRTKSNENIINKKFFLRSSSLNTKSFTEKQNEVEA